MNFFFWETDSCASVFSLPSLPLSEVVVTATKRPRSPIRQGIPHFPSSSFSDPEMAKTIRKEGRKEDLVPRRHDERHHHHSVPLSLLSRDLNHLLGLGRKRRRRRRRDLGRTFSLSHPIFPLSHFPWNTFQKLEGRRRNFSSSSWPLPT